MPTLTETLNKLNFSAGLTEGRTWCVDEQTEEATHAGEWRLLRNNNGVRVECDGASGFLVTAQRDKKYGSSYYNQAEDKWYEPTE